jgi:hypothetical protein
MLVEFDNLRDSVVRKDRDIKTIAKYLIDQENEIAVKNTRLVTSQVLECERELGIFDLENTQSEKNKKSDQPSS